MTVPPDDFDPREFDPPFTRAGDAGGKKPTAGHDTHEGLVIVQQQVTRLVRASLRRWLLMVVGALPAAAAVIGCGP